MFKRRDSIKTQGHIRKLIIKNLPTVVQGLSLSFCWLKSHVNSLKFPYVFTEENFLRIVNILEKLKFAVLQYILTKFTIVNLFVLSFTHFILCNSAFTLRQILILLSLQKSYEKYGEISLISNIGKKMQIIMFSSSFSFTSKLYL